MGDPTAPGDHLAATDHPVYQRGSYQNVTRTMTTDPIIMSMGNEQTTKPVSFPRRTEGRISKQTDVKPKPGEGF